MVGFILNNPAVTGSHFTMTDHSVQCFYGVQETHYNFEKTV